jgi:hypothetical protein
MTFSQNHPININVFNDDILVKSYIGNGVMWDAYPSFNISENSWKKVFERVSYMKLNFIRLMVGANDYCITFPKDGTPIYNFENNKIKRVCRILDYCQAHNVDVILGDWNNPQGKNKGIDSSKHELSWDGIDETDPRWTEMIGKFLDFLIKRKGYTCIKYFNLGNEPNGWWSSCKSFDTWKVSILNLDKELKIIHLRDKIKIVGPDASGADDWIKKIISDKELCKVIDAYEVHRYAVENELQNETYLKEMHYYRDYITKNDPNGAKKKLFMGEVGMLTGKNEFDQQKDIATFQYGVWMADFVVQSMNAGLAGLIAWDLDDAMHTSRRIKKGDDINDFDWKEWGFWDSFGNEKGHPELTKPRPWFFTWSLLSKFVPKGSQVLYTTPTGVIGLHISASKFISNRKTYYTFIIVNYNNDEKAVTIHLTDIGIKNMVFKQYDYFENNIAVDRSGFPVSKRKIKIENSSKGITAELPSKGVLILTTIK